MEISVFTFLCHPCVLNVTITILLCIAGHLQSEHIKKNCACMCDTSVPGIRETISTKQSQLSPTLTTQSINQSTLFAT